MTNQQVVAQSFVFTLISYHDLPHPTNYSYPKKGFYSDGWELERCAEHFLTEEAANAKKRELEKQWGKDRGWTYFGQFSSEEEAIAYLDQFGFTRTRGMVEYSGFNYEETWIWKHKDSDVVWQLRKIGDSDIQRWNKEEPDWHIKPLSEIPEDRLYPEVVLARKVLPRLEQEVENMNENLRREIEQYQQSINSHQKLIKKFQEVIRAHEQKKP